MRPDDAMSASGLDDASDPGAPDLGAPGPAASNPDEPTREHLTMMLNQAGAGDRDAMEAVWNMLHGEIRSQAAAAAAREADDLQPSMIVNEVYLKLFNGNVTEWQNRRHYFGAVSRAMQQFLIDRARTRDRLKRGGGRKRMPLTVAVGELAEYDQTGNDAVGDLMAALEELDREQPKIADVVRHRYLCGLTVDQTAELLGIAPRTVKKYWAFGRAWLRERLVEAGHLTAELDAEGEHEAEAPGAG